MDESVNVFVYQSFIDELAHLAGQDPLAFRLKLLGRARPMPYDDASYDSGRLRRVFEIAAEKASWKAPLPAGWGRGIAGSYANGPYVAIVAEVEVDQQYEVRARRMVVAADIGTVVNPLVASAQNRRVHHLWTISSLETQNYCGGRTSCAPISSNSDAADAGGTASRHSFCGKRRSAARRR